MKYMCSSESFTVTDGAFANRRFERGRTYDASEIPPAELSRFTPVSNDQNDNDYIAADAARASSDGGAQ